MAEHRDLPTLDDIIDATTALDIQERDNVLDSIDALMGLRPEDLDRPLTDFQTRVVEEYADRCDIRRTANALDVGRGVVEKEVIKPHVAKAVGLKLAERAERSELKADYVRSYVYGLLEMCPTDHFSMNEDGDWVVDPDQFRKVPQEIRRFVSEVEIVRDKFGRTSMKVKFVSKSQALAIAAKYTLTQKYEMDVNHRVPWDQVAISHDSVNPDADIEKALEEARAPIPA